MSSLTMVVTTAAAIPTATPTPVSLQGASSVAVSPTNPSTNSSNAMDRRLALINQLGDIIEAHETWNDPLSVQLHRWSTNFFKEAQKIIDGGTNYQTVQKVINTLAQEILIDRMFEKPFKNPYLDRRRWVWEKAEWDAYLDLGESFSPHDGQPIVATDATPHTFAQQILQWLNSISENEHSEEQSKLKEANSKESNTKTSMATIPAMSTLSAEQKKEKALDVTMLAQKAITFNASQAKIQKYTSLTSMMAAYTQELHQEVLVATEAAEKKFASHKTEIFEKVEDMKKTQAATVGVLESDLKRASQLLTTATAQLSQTQAVVSGQSSTIRQLREEINQMKETVNNLKDKDKKNCIIS